MLDADARLVHLHRGQRLGDYPALDDILTILDEVLAT